MLVNKYDPNTITLQRVLPPSRKGQSSIVLVCRFHLQLLQLNDVHPIRPIGSLSGTRVRDRLVHSANKLEHDLILLERELLFSSDALDQLLLIGLAFKSREAPSTEGTHTVGVLKNRL